MKKILAVLALSVAVAMMFGGVAYANFGPHGGYASDTDACAGCHRAHTSFSQVTWTDSGDNSHSALLVSSATTIKEFCYACHGDGAPGASTNVQTGVFDAGPSGPAGTAIGGSNGGVTTMYATNSTFNAPLNGGGFGDHAGGQIAVGVGTYASVSSAHDMDQGAATDPMWGRGSAAPAGANLTCIDCHDPHGSSNYRLLKDSLNGTAVGGYDTNDNPTPFVVSAETGFPAGGWAKHTAGSTQMANYKPDYTAPQYAYQPPALVGGVATFRSMSAWCSGCHQQYDNKDSAYDYGTYEAALSNASVEVGSRERHRHPVDITLAAGNGAGRALAAQVATDSTIPLELRPGKTGFSNTDQDFQDYLGCLTCHRAHGTAATMSGWARASLDTSASAVVTWFPVLDPAKGGVNPNHSSALLRDPNRGVCERCHNK